jgi:hypothetical protein
MSGRATPRARTRDADRPEQPVAPKKEPQAGAGAQDDGELLPQEQVLEHERLAATERSAQCAD